jgi:hypothetical protein
MSAYCSHHSLRLLREWIREGGEGGGDRIIVPVQTFEMQKAAARKVCFCGKKEEKGETGKDRRIEKKKKETEEEEEEEGEEEEKEGDRNAGRCARIIRWNFCNKTRLSGCVWPWTHFAISRTAGRNVEHLRVADLSFRDAAVTMALNRA